MLAEPHLIIGNDLHTVMLPHADAAAVVKTTEE
jgi:hypothetical protein